MVLFLPAVADRRPTAGVATVPLLLNRPELTCYHYWLLAKQDRVQGSAREASHAQAMRPCLAKWGCVNVVWSACPLFFRLAGVSTMSIRPATHETC